MTTKRELNIQFLQETKKLWHFIKGVTMETKQAQKENMFIQICEALCEAEAKLLISALKIKDYIKCIKVYQKM